MKALQRMSAYVVIATMAVGSACQGEAADSVDAKQTATLRALMTNVDLALGADGAFRRARSGSKLRAGDQLRTDPTGWAELHWRDGSLTRLGSATTLRISPLAKLDQRKTRLELDVGETWHRVERLTGSSSYEVETPTGVAAVRGTRFAVVCTPTPTCSYAVVEGTIEVSPPGQPSVTLNAGQRLTLVLRQPPVVEDVGVDALRADPFIAENEELDNALGSVPPTTELAVPATTFAASPATTRAGPAAVSPQGTGPQLAFSITPDSGPGNTPVTISISGCPWAGPNERAGQLNVHHPSDPPENPRTTADFATREDGTTEFEQILASTDTDTGPRDVVVTCFTTGQRASRTFTVTS